MPETLPPPVTVTARARRCEVRTSAAGLALGLLVGLLAWSSHDLAAQSKPPNADLQRQSIEVSATPIKHFSRTNSTTTFGKLTFRGGLVLTSPDSHFGGFSGLEIEPDGKKIVAVSDAGSWMTAEIEYSDATPRGLRNVRIGPLMTKGGKSLAKDRDRDAEAVRLVGGTLSSGSLLISFEQNSRIGRFEITPQGLLPPTHYLKMPPELRRFKRNQSLESLAVLKAGPFSGSAVAFPEGMVEKDDRHTGWIWVKGEPQRFLLNNPGKFNITDAVSLADGSLIVLSRRFGWLEGVKMRLQRLPASEIKPGAVIEGEVLLEADMSSDIDNMEGIAAHRNAAGETVLTLISDNNFNNFLQRTILLQFTLETAQAQAARR